MAKALLETAPGLSHRHVYELSSRGPFFRFLHSRCGQLTFSEFFPEVATGSTSNGIPCQDIQQLTYDDESFDVCTSTDVFEHVPDDGRAFSEMFRVLKPGGCAVFTVPLNTRAKTVERARLVDGGIEYMLPPEFHHDHLQGLDQVLCFRNYGADILARLEEQGFRDARIILPDPLLYWGYGRPVVVAYR